MTTSGTLAAEASHQLAESLRNQVNLETVDRLQELTNAFAAAIGESEEAWRGVLGTVGFVGMLIQDVPKDEDTAREAIAHIHGLMVLICDSPGAQAAMRKEG